MKLKSILFALIAVSLTGGFTVLWLAPDRLALAPNITVTTLQGKELRISQPQGKPLLVNFWASGCRSCLEEMRHLSQL